MGKAQSKRSVDITTETKDGTVEEGSGKMGKIEDVDQLKPQKLNGGTNHKDSDPTTVSTLYLVIHEPHEWNQQNNRSFTYSYLEANFLKNNSAYIVINHSISSPYIQVSCVAFVINYRSIY